MPSRQDDAVAWRSRDAAGPGPVRRSLALGAALVLVIAATAGAFLTDDARYLRLAVLAAAWSFLAAALLSGRHRGEHAPVPGEEEPWPPPDRAPASERELARLREELAEVGDLRAGLAELSALRAEVAALSALRAEVAGLSALRADVSALAGLRGEVAALSAVRADLAGLTELRADLARLRAELATQLDGEMLVERMVMRTQAGRLPVDRGPSLEVDRPSSSGRFDGAAPPPAGPRTAAFSLAASLPSPAAPAPPTPLQWLADRAVLDPEELPADARSRHAAADPALDRPGPAPQRRRRTDDGGPDPFADPAEAVTSEQRASAAGPPVAFPASTAPPDPLAAPGRAPLPGEPEGHVRLAEILAANGAVPTGGPRRRHRYREDDEPDDVLARVLGRD